MSKNKEKGVFVPDDVMFDPRLSSSEKILFAMALNLNREGSNGCFANNRYFAERINVDQRQIRRMWKKLKKFKLIEVIFNFGRLIYTMPEHLQPHRSIKRSGAN